MKSFLFLLVLLFSCLKAGKIEFIPLSLLTETYTVFNGTEKLIRRNDYFLVEYDSRYQNEIFSLITKKANQIADSCKTKYNHYTISFYDASILNRKKYLENDPNNISIEDLMEEHAIKFYEWNNGINNDIPQ